MTIDEMFNELENKVRDTYIVTLKYKYDFEKNYTIENHILVYDSMVDRYDWLDDWYEGQTDVEVLGYRLLSDIDNTKLEPCEDAISRKETLDKINALFAEYIPLMLPGWNLPLIIGRTICGMPPVTSQQKATGSWVGKQVIDNEEVEIKQWQSARCSKCGKYNTTPYLYYFDDYNYCPNCGAKMEVLNNDSRKRKSNQ